MFSVSCTRVWGRLRCVTTLTVRPRFSTFCCETTCSIIYTTRPRNSSPSRFSPSWPITTNGLAISTTPVSANWMMLVVTHCVWGFSYMTIVTVLSGSGRIKAIQLEYSEARRTLTNALRKAPQHTAVGFKQTVSFSLWHTDFTHVLVVIVVWWLTLGLSGPQAVDRSWAVTGWDTRPSAVSSAVSQEISHAVLSAHSR